MVLAGRAVPPCTVLTGPGLERTLDNAVTDKTSQCVNSLLGKAQTRVRINVCPEHRSEHGTEELVLHPGHLLSDTEETGAGVRFRVSVACQPRSGPVTCPVTEQSSHSLTPAPPVSSHRRERL